MPCQAAQFKRRAACTLPLSPQNFPIKTHVGIDDASSIGFGIFVEEI
jgi:hypothetical protein